MKRIGIYPSIMVAKPWEIKEYIKHFEEVDVDAIHFDVMDGHYVPNIMLGTNEFKAIRSVTYLPIDVHLMVKQPEKFIDYFDLKENDMCSFHPETTDHPYRLLQNLKTKGVKAGLAISPATSLEYIENCMHVLDFVLVMSINPGFAGQILTPDHLNKLERINYLVSKADHKIEIIVDGNTNIENTKKMMKNGATGVVSGTSYILKNGPDEFIKRFNEFNEEINK